LISKTRTGEKHCHDRHVPFSRYYEEIKRKRRKLLFMSAKKKIIAV